MGSVVLAKEVVGASVSAWWGTPSDPPPAFKCAHKQQLLLIPSSPTLTMVPATSAAELSLLCSVTCLEMSTPRTASLSPLPPLLQSAKALARVAW